MNNTAVTLCSELFPFISGVRRVVNSPSVVRYHPAAKLLLVVGGMSKNTNTRRWALAAAGYGSYFKLLQDASGLAKLEKMFILMYPLVNKQLLKMAIYS